MVLEPNCRCKSNKKEAYMGYEDVFMVLLGKTQGQISVCIICQIWQAIFPSVQIILETQILHKYIQGGHHEILKAMLNHSRWWNKFMREMDESYKEKERGEKEQDECYSFRER